MGTHGFPVNWRHTTAMYPYTFDTFSVSGPLRTSCRTDSNTQGGLSMVRSHPSFEPPCPRVLIVLPSRALGAYLTDAVLGDARRVAPQPCNFRRISFVPTGFIVDARPGPGRIDHGASGGEEDDTFDGGRAGSGPQGAERAVHRRDDVLVRLGGSEVDGRGSMNDRDDVFSGSIECIFLYGRLWR